MLPYLFDKKKTETSLLIISFHPRNLMDIFINFIQLFCIHINILKIYENPEGCINILQPIPLYHGNIRSSLAEIEPIENKMDYTDYEKEIIRNLRTI